MKKSDLKRSLQGSAKGDGVMSVAEYMRWRGVCWRTATRQLDGLDYFPDGKHGRHYLIDDIAQRLMEEKRA